LVQAVRAMACRCRPAAAIFIDLPVPESRVPRAGASLHPAPEGRSRPPPAGRAAAGPAFPRAAGCGMLGFGRTPKVVDQGGRPRSSGTGGTVATAAERGRQVRARLVEAAAGLIGERGWAGVSTRTVAERAGVAPGLVHYHYSSVQALLGEAALQVVGEVAAAAADELGPGVGLEEGVDRLPGTLDAFPGDDPTSRGRKS